MKKQTTASKLFTLILSLFLYTSIDVDACTGIKLVAKDGSSVHGRTLESEMNLDISVAVVPRDFAFFGTTSDGKGIAYTSKYGAVGVMAFDEISLLDGINEKGLAVGTFYFPGFAGYAPLSQETQSKSLSPLEFPNWILTQFATIDEVLAALPEIVIVGTVSKNWGSTPPPFHYIVYDKNGKCLVIEPAGGRLTAYENRLGTYTNSPNFGWHMMNLRNYVNLSPNNVSPMKISGVFIQAYGSGSGLLGLPGDFTSPSRFVRAAFFSSFATPSETADESVFQAFHILNLFDIPYGLSQQKAGEQTVVDYTILTCVRDPQALKYYFKTYDDQNIRMIDLSKYDLNGKTVKKAGVSGKTQVVDFTKELK